MKSPMKIITLFGILFAAIAIIATVTTSIVLIGKKQKSDEDMDIYLEGGIQ